MPLPNGSSLIFQLTVAACLINVVITVTTFALYIRTRMADRSADPRLDEAAQARKLAELDRKENRYQSIHFITLFLFVLFGVLVLIQLSNRYNNVPPGGHYSGRARPGSFAGLRPPIAPAPKNTPVYLPAGSTAPTNRS